MDGPDALALRQFFEGARFRSGVFRKKWRLVDLKFPHATVEIRCPDDRWLAIRFECSGYPSRLPTGAPWDVRGNARLAAHLWPRGEKRISAVFNPGYKGGIALYIPCDREAFDGHVQWPQDHPEMIWDAARGLEVYLEAVIQTLHTLDFYMAAT